MAVAHKSNAGAVNLDGTVAVLATTIAVSIGDAVLVNVGVLSAIATVQSVVDDSTGSPNSYTKLAGLAASDSISYELGHYAPFSRTANAIDGELWATIATATATKVTVTLTTGAKFVVEIQSFSGANSSLATACPSGNRAAVKVTSVSPAVTATLDASASFLAAGFTSAFAIDESGVPVHGTFRQQKAGVTPTNGVSVTAADFTGNTAATVQLNPGKTNTIPEETATTDDVLLFDRQQLEPARVAIAPALTYVVCSTEVHA